jgi:hypothetical protein
VDLFYPPRAAECSSVKASEVRRPQGAESLSIVGIGNDGGASSFSFHWNCAGEKFSLGGSRIILIFFFLHAAEQSTAEGDG